MSNFIRLRDLGIQQKYMGFVQYEKISGGGKEFLWQHNWDIEIPVPPKAVYWLDTDILRARTSGLEFTISKEPMAKAEVNIRGFKIVQTAGYDSSGQLTLRLLDYEDQSSFAILQTFLQAVGANEFKFHFRKEDYIIRQLSVYFLNTTRDAVRRYDFYTLVFTGGDYDTETPTEPSDVRKEITLNFDFEHHRVALLNVTPEMVF